MSVIRKLRPKNLADETSPILNEIWQLGYDIMETDYAADKITLINQSKNYTKEIDLFAFSAIINSFRLKLFIDMNGDKHYFVPNADEDLKKLLDLIR